MNTGMKIGAEWINANQDALGNDVTVMAPAYERSAKYIVYDYYFRDKYHAGDLHVTNMRGRGDVDDIESDTVVIFVDSRTNDLEYMLSKRYDRDTLAGPYVNVWRKR